ncbi:MAG TPA: serine hydrolase [Planctomycetota bacterium]|nr:serine hydrolase [Planctomycetota bacterium]
MNKVAPVLVWLACLFCAASARESYDSIQDAASDAFQTWVERTTKDAHRVISISGYDIGGEVRFSAVSVKDGAAIPTEVRHNLANDEYAAALKQMRADGFRLICVSGYLNGGAPHFAAVWVKDGKHIKWEEHHNITAEQYQSEVERAKERGLRPEIICGYGNGRAGHLFAALFVESQDEWFARHDLAPEQYQKLYDDPANKGFRPLCATEYRTKSGPMFAAIFVKEATPMIARHNLTETQFHNQARQNEKNGFHLLSVSACSQEPSAGVEIFEKTIKEYMKERSIAVGTIAVAYNGKMLLEKAYGHRDGARTQLVQADDPMRIASVVKPITAAAVRKLIAEGKLALDTKAFPLLGLKPLPGAKEDPRINTITVQNLLDHKGGWDRDTSFDPMFMPLEIAKANGKPGPADQEQIIRYMLGKPLQADPGSKYAYSNFGYCVLGRVIEKVSKQNYVAYIQKEILAPLDIHSIELGRSLPKDRNPREPVYVDPGVGRNVIEPKSEAQVPAPDGTFFLEAMDSHGALIASSPDLCKFMNAYWISGEPRKGTGQSWVHFGSLPGTFSMASEYGNGVNVACIFNQRTDKSGLDYEKINDMMGNAANQFAGTEARYVAVWVKD